LSLILLNSKAPIAIPFINNYIYTNH
jgi:hypothetical protein